MRTVKRSSLLFTRLLVVLSKLIVLLTEERMVMRYGVQLCVSLERFHEKAKFFSFLNRKYPQLLKNHKKFFCELWDYPDVEARQNELKDIRSGLQGFINFPWKNIRIEVYEIPRADFFSRQWNRNLGAIVCTGGYYTWHHGGKVKEVLKNFTIQQHGLGEDDIQCVILSTSEGENDKSGLWLKFYIPT